MKEIDFVAVTRVTRASHRGRSDLRRRGDVVRRDRRMTREQSARKKFHEVISRVASATGTRAGAHGAANRATLKRVFD